jgi:uncharacterized membrane protein YedE/YeeE
MKLDLFRQNLTSFAVGFIFAIGLAVSGMTQPQKVIGFLDFQNWDPSLIFVMIGAVAVHFVAVVISRRKKAPFFAREWNVPARKDLTARLFIGSAIFGIGWGLGGFCPGPAVTSLAAGSSQVFLFVGAMIVGMLIFKKAEPYLHLHF